MIRGLGGQTVSCNLRDATTGAAFTGTVTVYVDGDHTGQIVGSVNGGVCNSRGHGEFDYQPSAAETDYAHIAFTFDGLNALGDTVQVDTVTAAVQTALSAATGASAITVGDLITAAFKRINIVQAGGTASPEDMADGLLRLRGMLGLWRLERLTIPFLARTTWTITSTKGTTTNPYTVGVGGDVNIARPSLPNDILVRYLDTNVTPAQERRLTPLTDDAYALIGLKDLTAPLPSYYYYNPTYAGNLGSLYLWYVPTNTGLQGVLYAPAALQDYGALTDSLVLPDGYVLALQENLAVLLFPEWREGVPLDPILAKSAIDTKAALKTANVRLMDLAVDPAVLPRSGTYYSIYSDGPA